MPRYKQPALNRAQRQTDRPASGRCHGIGGRRRWAGLGCCSSRTRATSFRQWPSLRPVHDQQPECKRAPGRARARCLIRDDLALGSEVRAIYCAGPSAASPVADGALASRRDGGAHRLAASRRADACLSNFVGSRGAQVGGGAGRAELLPRRTDTSFAGHIPIALTLIALRRQFRAHAATGTGRPRLSQVRPAAGPRWLMCHGISARSIRATTPNRARPRRARTMMIAKARSMRRSPVAIWM